MNASPKGTGRPGDEPVASDRDYLPETLPVFPDATADDTTDDDGAADPTGLSSVDPLAAGLCPAVSEQQLAAWLSAIVDRDERALTALYDATCSRVFGIAQRILRCAALTEEVVEETYFQVWRQAARFDPSRGHALTWLLAITRSRAIDALRHETRFRHDGMDDEHVADIANEQRPSDELLDLARHQAELHQALMQLGAQPRQLVSLAFFRGFSHEEIAQETQLPLGTVKSQIRRALQSLRQILGERGPTSLSC